MKHIPAFLGVYFRNENGIEHGGIGVLVHHHNYSLNLSVCLAMIR